MNVIAPCIAMLVLITGVGLPSSAEDVPEGKKTLQIELPEAYFGGTRIGYWSPILEEISYKDRPAYYVPEDVTLLSKNKPVTSSTTTPLLGTLKMITDGNKDFAKSSLVELESGLQWIQIDLEKEFTLYAIVVWHFHEGERVYFDIVAQCSNDKQFKTNDTVTTLYNNDHDNSAGRGIGNDKEYFETYKGRLIKMSEGSKARYIRLYSQGNTANSMNHYVEVEVFGTK